MTEPRVAIAYDCLFPVNAGGGERVYRRLAELFVDRGSEVDYLTRRQWSGKPPPASFEIVGVWNGEIYDSGGTRTTASALAFAWALFRAFLRRRGDHDLVIVSALPVLNVFAVRLALLGSGTLLVSDWLEVWSARQWRAYSGAAVGTVAAILQRIGLRISRVHTANSEFTAERIRRYRPRAAPIVLGLVDLVGASSDTPGVPVDPPFVLFVGRHIADKRLSALPAALAEARRRIPDLRAIVVGSGPETSVAVAAAEKAGVADEIEFTGRVSDERLEQLFRTAAALVNPSAREGFGLVVAEAAAFGTPSVVVAGEDNAAAELVESGVNGVVASSVSSTDLGSAIVRAVEAGPALRAATLRWFETARVDRSLRVSVDRLLDTYRGISPR
ncbi:glycosyltransferase family 4 protein [Agromyces sp. NPDC058136]|uniref:glycosyltransferase family 4 protein n=1 Tax=Agromyces sp. NPDC058136 TaxID=3346354 RepID=UPI0036DD350D